MRTQTMKCCCSCNLRKHGDFCKFQILCPEKKGLDANWIQNRKQHQQSLFIVCDVIIIHYLQKQVKRDICNLEIIQTHTVQVPCHCRLHRLIIDYVAIYYYLQVNGQQYVILIFIQGIIRVSLLYYSERFIWVKFNRQTHNTVVTYNNSSIPISMACATNILTQKISEDCLFKAHVRIRLNLPVFFFFFFLCPPLPQKANLLALNPPEKCT
eukprot:TRINITY_DN6783_c0_g1_i2.p2 TRINITY_DN6783_c0_g1~~TRINITY_DN6783_c0_g1_i2.p2  ORF type:complete len:211 (-),score=-8.73 TRINITY_DN6783_c0_g1_i2:46-678(-)